MWSNKSQVKWNNYFPSFIGYFLIDTAQYVVSFYCCQGTLVDLTSGTGLSNINSVLWHLMI